MAIGILLRQFIDQVFDARCRNRIERRTGLVHQDDFGIDGDGACDAQALLLPTGEAGTRIVEPVLDLVDQVQRVRRLP
jgi:hypothetical protein